jgi:homoserine kinase
MPYLHEVRFAAKRAGALGLVISGAGPTLCAVCADEATAARVANTMQEFYAAAGLHSLIRHGKIRTQGAAVTAVS